MRLLFAATAFASLALTLPGLAAAADRASAFGISVGSFTEQFAAATESAEQDLPSAQIPIVESTISDGEIHRTLTYFTPRIVGFQLGLGQDDRPHCQPGGAAAGDCDTGYGAPGFRQGDPRSWSIGGNFGYGGLVLGGSYSRQEDALALGGEGRRDLNLGLSYNFDSLTIGASYRIAEADRPTGPDSGSGISLGASYRAAPGMHITGGLQYFGWNADPAGAAGGDQESWNFLIGTRVLF